MGVIAQYLRVSEDELTLYQAKSVFLEKRMKSKSVDADHWLDIDQVWSGIIYLLTGNGLEKASGQLLRVIVGTRYIDESLDFGCGPAHYLDACEVQDLYEELSTWDKTKLYERFDVDHMKSLEILPDGCNDDEAFETLYEYFVKIKAFYHKAAINNEAIVGVMSSEQYDVISCADGTQRFASLERSSNDRIENMVISMTIIASCIVSYIDGTSNVLPAVFGSNGLSLVLNSQLSNRRAKTLKRI